MDVHEIRVSERDHGAPDPRVSALRSQAAAMLGHTVDAIIVNVFRAEGDLTPEQVQVLGAELFTDPNTQTFDTSDRANWDDPNVTEIAYQLGVMNPAEESILKGAKLLGVPVEAVSSSTEVRFIDTPREVIDDVVSKLLVNKTVQRVLNEKPETLKISGEPGSVEIVPIMELDGEGLEQVSKDRSLFLDASEMRNIQDYFKSIGREPTDGELEYLGAAWSEHCCHKTFNAKIFTPDGREKDPLFKRLKDTSKRFFKGRVPSAFDDNAGVFEFYDGIGIAIKLETHNSPSALEPYGGSMTGSGGVFRDVMGVGKGGKNILSIDIFCTADPDTPNDQLMPNTLSPDYLLRRIIDGVRDYGNRMGIPTANGSIHHHPRFQAKPTVMVGSIGEIPLEFAQKGSPKHGDLVIAVGGRTGRDGIHGATFSSGSMTAETAAVHSSAVQIGNAIEEKRMADALIEARDAGLIRAITDCGAAGFASAIGEMGEDIGVSIDLAKAPLKYAGLAPWEILMSESQERMVTAIAPNDYEAFQAICRKHGVEETALGSFGTVGGAKLDVRYGDQQVVDMDYEFIKRGRTQRELVANWQAPQVEEITIQVSDWNQTLKSVMAHGNVRSREKVVRQYDHEVQGMSAMKPYGGVHMDAPNDAAVLKPILGKAYGVVVAHGMNPQLNDLDPYWGTVWSFAEAMGNYVSAGGDPEQAFAANNFVTATPDEHVMGVLDKAVDAICDSVEALEVPIISGKDSLSSRYKNGDTVVDIPPVTTITVAGKVENIVHTVTTDIKQPGSTLVVVGQMDFTGMGGSVLYDVTSATSARVPQVNLTTLATTLKRVHAAMQTDQILACHDVSEGGVAAAIAEMCFGGDCGAELELMSSADPENLLFNETAGVFVIEVADDQTAHKLFKNIPYRVLGKTTADKKLKASHNSYRSRYRSERRNLFDIATDELKAAWKQPMEEFYK